MCFRGGGLVTMATGKAQVNLPTVVNDRWFLPGLQFDPDPWCPGRSVCDRCMGNTRCAVVRSNLSTHLLPVLATEPRPASCFITLGLVYEY